jgi:hypothetical protein
MEENMQNRAAGRNRIQITPHMLLAFLTNRMHNLPQAVPARHALAQAGVAAGGNDAVQRRRAMLIHEILGRLQPQDAAE